MRNAGFDPASVDIVAMSHLHFDHAGGLLLADGARAFPRARIVAQRAEWEIALGDNSRVVASYDQPELRLVARLGRGGLGGGRPRAAAGRVGDPDGGPLRRPPGDPRARHRARRAVARVLRRPVHAAVVGQPALGHGVRRLPARQRQVKGELFRRAVEEDWLVALSHESRMPVGTLVPDRDRFRFEGL